MATDGARQRRDHRLSLIRQWSPPVASAFDARASRTPRDASTAARIHLTEVVPDRSSAGSSSAATPLPSERTISCLYSIYTVIQGLCDETRRRHRHSPVGQPEAGWGAVSPETGDADCFYAIAQSVSTIRPAVAKRPAHRSGRNSEETAAVGTEIGSLAPTSTQRGAATRSWDSSDRSATETRPTCQRRSGPCLAD